MSKKINDEIDLVDFFLIVWNKKLSVALIIILSIIITFAAQTFKPPSKIVATSEVKPISVYDEVNYQIYNLFINTVTPTYMQNRAAIDESKQGTKKQKITIPDNITDKNIVINKIEKKFLYDLFIDLLQEKTFLVDSIKEFQLIKRDNYSNNLEYNKAINEIANSIDLLNIELQDIEGNTSPIIIRFVSLNLDNWENFLKYLEKQINILIQKRLSNMLESYIDYVIAIKQFQVNDIISKLETVNLNEDLKFNLERSKEILLKDKYIEKIQEIFSSSPIANPDFLLL